MFEQNIKKNRFSSSFENKKGFVLLFAIVMAGLILSMTMGIANLTLKEIIFSTSTRDGSDAVFAADVGVECASFNDKSGNNKFPRTGPATPITCFGTSITPTFTVPAANQGQYDFTVNGLNNSLKGCAKVTVLKSNTNPLVGETTTITAKGYNLGGDATCNSTSRNLLERRVQLTFMLPPTNVALASEGATITASTTYSADYPASAVINGDRRGIVWGAGGGWNDHSSSSGVYPDRLEITFIGSKTINMIDVFTLQDNYANPIEPLASTTFTTYGIIRFRVDHWFVEPGGGAYWQTIPGCDITGNTYVWRRCSFSPITTTKIRLSIFGALNNYSRVVEVQAWTP